ncbi:rCG30130 [Rattus norvegicus]|uniref:RCG30130 n=1 Tax=Rattus norvegicus TaxID=10116 RepID=A6IN02_RAT|nr:rCG30130 [Rattus norvegicus]
MPPSMKKHLLAIKSQLMTAFGKKPVFTEMQKGSRISQCV